MIKEIFERLKIIEQFINNVEETEIIDVQPIVQEPEICCICLEDIVDNNKNFVALECSHQLHFNCFMNFINSNGDSKKCPLCRAEINYNNEVEMYDEEIYNAFRVNLMNMLGQRERIRNIAGDFYLYGDRMYCQDWILELMTRDVQYSIDVIDDLLINDGRVSYTLNNIRSAVSTLVRDNKLSKIRIGRHFRYVLV